VPIIKKALDKVKSGHQFMWHSNTLQERIAMGKNVTAALRLGHMELEQRSLRRGALQTMADKGVSEEVMLQFSGHTTVAMLRRYLDWGRKGMDRAKGTRSAATFLAGGSS
jgi:hypothetical protein